MLNRRADKLEVLRIAEAVALEKSIDKELIIDSMESGIAKAAKSKFGSENEITVQINRDNGDIGIFRKLKIVEKPMNLNLEIGLNEAISINKDNEEKKIGDEILQPLPSFDFGRIAAQTAKQVITFSVREAERQRGRETKGQRGRDTDRQSGRQEARHIGIERQRDRDRKKKERQSDRETDT